MGESEPTDRVLGQSCEIIKEGVLECRIAGA